MSRRGRGRSDSDAISSPNLTPLLDVVLQLITFFMMLIHFGSKIEGETKAVRLPTTPAALPGGDLGLDRLVVAVDVTGRLLAEGSSFDESSAVIWWAEKAKSRRSGRATIRPGDAGDELPTLVVIRADKDASYGAVRRLLGAAQDQGFAHFTLVVLRGPNP
jgi:biopolymer transport protein ExbD